MPKDDKIHMTGAEPLSASAWSEGATDTQLPPSEKYHYAYDWAEANKPYFLDLFVIQLPSLNWLGRKIIGSKDTWWRCYEAVFDNFVQAAALMRAGKSAGRNQLDNTRRPSLYEDLTGYKPLFAATGYRPNKMTEILFKGVKVYVEVNAETKCVEYEIEMRKLKQHFSVPFFAVDASKGIIENAAAKFVSEALVEGMIPVEQVSKFAIALAKALKGAKPDVPWD